MKKANITTNMQDDLDQTKTEHKIDRPILWVAQWNRWRFRICEPDANTKECTTTPLVWMAGGMSWVLKDRMFQLRDILRH